MIGKVTIKQVDKSTGSEEVIFQENNQLTEGVKHAIVNVLTGNGSTDINDYKFRYFQLGNQKYDLSTYDISGDLTSSAFKSYFWTLKSPLTISEYGRDSRWGVSNQNTYILGSTYPSGTGTTKVVDNFVEPPDTKTVLNEFSNLMATPKDGTSSEDVSLLSSIWIPGCADTWTMDPENRYTYPLSSFQDFSVTGPTGFAPAWGFSFTPNRYLADTDGSPVFDSICVRTNHGYVYEGPVDNHTQNEEMVIYTKLKKNQTWSGYYAGHHYVSANDEAYNPDPDAAGARHPLSSTVVTGRHQIFNRYAQALVGTEAGQNRITFEYRYNFDNSAATYTPCALEVSSGWQLWKSAGNNPGSDFSSVYNLTGEAEYGVVSANIYNKYGPLYTYADHLNHYRTFTGTGAAYKDVSAVGFGPSGNFYRVSLSWANAPDKMINFYKGFTNGTEFKGQGMVPFGFPILSSLSGLSGIAPFGNAGVGMAGKGKVVGQIMPETTPRSKAYYGCVQWDYDASVGPFQNVHAEESYYLTLPQDFVKIPEGYTTRLVDNTTNIRLEVDENLANAQTLREVGLFMKNPSGAKGTDVPFLGAYKLLPCDINKTNQFSYIIDWELSFMDSSVSYTEQSIAEDGCTSS